MSKTYTTKIKDSYVTLRSLYLGVDAVKENQLVSGDRLTVVVEDSPEVWAQGMLNPGHGVSGMAKLYTALRLKTGDTLTFKVAQPGGPIVVIPSASPVSPPAAAAPGETVFKRMNLKHLHIEPFRPENLFNWEPENETDIYLALGVLQEYTDFEYCCATSQALLDSLGATHSSKPDAILIDRNTGEYLVAEMKKYASAFKSNHSVEDVDVLVCWVDDETERSKVPARIVVLSKVARVASAQRLDEDAG